MDSAKAESLPIESDSIDDEKQEIEEITTDEIITKAKKKKNKPRRKKKAQISEIEIIPVQGSENFPIQVVKGQGPRGRYVVATRDLEPGDLVLESRCYGLGMTVSGPWCEATCHCCLEIVTKTILRCGGCNVAHYCSQKCRQLDRPFHEVECAILPKLLQIMSMEEDSLTLRLTARIAALSARDKETDKPLDAMWPCYAHVDMLEDHVTNSNTSPATREQLVGAAITIAQTLQSFFNISAEKVLHILLAIQSNAHGKRIQQPYPLLALGIFPLASMLNHSCVPNCHHHIKTKPFTYPVLEFRAIKKVSKGEELVYSYTDLYQTTSKRKATLEAAYRFVCQCARCSNGESTEERQEVSGLARNDIKTPENYCSADSDDGLAEEEIKAEKALIELQNMMSIVERTSDLNISRKENGDASNQVECSESELMIGGALCPNSESCKGLMISKESSTDAECQKCHMIEAAESYQRRLDIAEARLTAMYVEAFKTIGTVQSKGIAAALAARDLCLAALVGNSVLHPNHYLVLKVNLILAQACEHILSDNAKKKNANREMLGDAGTPELEVDKFQVLVDKTTAHAAALKAMRTCIGGNQPEIAKEMFELGQSLSELAFNKLMVPSERLQELSIPSMDLSWVNPLDLFQAAIKLLQDAQCMYEICLGRDSADVCKTRDALEFLFEAIDKTTNSGNSGTTKPQSGKKKKKTGKKKH